ncbi:MAG: T9SS type A sorting domain-containing protein [Prevotella sp.]|jgi:hypothetical protein|nr:T9SS type A sorting domain-containing protein [Prevotella sp.]
MKKNVLFGILASTMLCSGSVVFAQGGAIWEDYRKLTIYESAKPTIDGLADEALWTAPGVVSNPIDRIITNWGAEGSVENTWGYAATFKATYDYYNLYLLIQVTDGTYVPYDAAQMGGEYKIDNIELFFYPDPATKDLFDGATIPDARNRGLSQLRASVGNNDNRATGAGLVAGYIVENKITGYEYKTAQTAEGYNIEIVVPWDVVIPDEFVDNLDTGGTILFDINAANCTDYASDRVIMMGWSTNDVHAWKANFKMGELTFGGTYSAINTSKAPALKHALLGDRLQLSGVNSNAAVSIYDISGRKVLSATGASVNLAGLTSGVYVVDVKGNGNFKIIK